MNKHLALAYGFAGLAVAAALIAFVTTSTAPEPVEVAAQNPVVAADRSNAAGSDVASDLPEAAVEYVYVDEPARAGRYDEHGDRDGDDHDDDDDDDDRDRDDRNDRDHDDARGGHHDD